MEKKYNFYGGQSSSLKTLSNELLQSSVILYTQRVSILYLWPSPGRRDPLIPHVSRSVNFHSLSLLSFSVCNQV